MVKDCPKTNNDRQRNSWENRDKKRWNFKKPSVAPLTTPSKKQDNRLAYGKSMDDNTAVVQAELGGFKFSCRIDSGADKTCISETIVNFLGDHGIFLPTRLLSKPEKLNAIDGHIVHSKGTAQISPLIQTVAGPCRLRNVKVKILEDQYTYVSPGNACSGEIVLGNPFLIASGLNVKDFLANLQMTIDN